MFENKKNPTLGDKIAELIAKYKAVCEENEKLKADIEQQKAEVERLKGEVAGFNAKREALDAQISQLEDDASIKQMSEEELFKQIDDVLNPKAKK